MGLASLGIIWWRLKSDLTADKISYIAGLFSQPSTYGLLAAALLLMPVNWGIESLKWQMVTKGIEPIPYSTATRSVYAGVCAGNLAPGRASEFVAKILFFAPANRSNITLLHFASGMFQLSVTILIGLAGLLLQLGAYREAHSFIFGLSVVAGVILLIAFTWIILNFHKVQPRLLRRLQKNAVDENNAFHFERRLIARLLLWSLVRYAVFSAQLLLVIRLFNTGPVSVQLLSSVGIYFLLTTALPMISVLEPAIRAAIALMVFRSAGLDETAAVLVALLMWLINIVLPSIVGYVIIVQEKFEFRNFKR